MIRLNEETTLEVLNEVKTGDFVTDGFSKTGIVKQIDIEDDGLYKRYHFVLNTNREILIRR